MDKIKSELEYLFKTNTPNMFPLVGESYEEKRIVVLTPYIVATKEALNMLESISKGEKKDYSPFCNKLHSEAWNNQLVDKRITIHQAFKRYCRLQEQNVQEKDVIFYSFLITYPTNCIYRNKKLVDPNNPKEDKDISDLSCGYAGSPWNTPKRYSCFYFSDFLKKAKPKEIWVLGQNCIEFIKHECDFDIERILKKKDIKLKIIDLRKTKTVSSPEENALTDLKKKADKIKQIISKLYPRGDDKVKLKFEEFYKTFLNEFDARHEQ